MIDGVKIKQLKVHQDIPDTDQPGVKLGALMEVLRSDDEMFTKFGQSVMTVAYKGNIKAFHYHELQDDVWFAASGKSLIVLHDLREDSLTHGETMTLTAGTDDYKVIRIPIGVAHGYKVLSDEPVIMLYHTSEVYNPAKPDEKRLPHNDPKVGFNWEAYT